MCGNNIKTCRKYMKQIEETYYRCGSSVILYNSRQRKNNMIIWNNPELFFC